MCIENIIFHFSIVVCDLWIYPYTTNYENYEQKVWNKITN